MRKGLAIGAFCGAAVLSSGVNADAISYSQLTSGSQSVTGLSADGSATAYSSYATATLGKLSRSSVLGLNPAAGVGGSLRIGDPLVNGTEAIVFAFSKLVVIDRLDVALLYRGIPDLPEEPVTFTAKDADNVAGSFALKPTALTTASYAVSAAPVHSESFGVFGGWDLVSPFGNGVANQVILDTGSSTDYAFERMLVTPIPLPAAVWGGLALMGVIGVISARKRRLVA